MCASAVDPPTAPGMPPEDRVLSPYTGWTREHWAVVADRLLLAVRPYSSPARARILLPGHRSAYGTDSDGLEGFARSFLLVAFRLRGADGHDPHGFLDRYRAGLLAGTDPGSPERWPRPDELGQAKVEAASIALGLQLTRPWLWDRLDDRERTRVVDWLATVVGQPYPRNNWIWFQIVVETFLAAVGGPYRAADLEAGLALHESLARPGGWYSDGDERAYDHYAGWALHFYPLVWTRLAGVHLGVPAPVDEWAERLRSYLDDHVALIGADGSPLLQGRSLTYRFAAAAPLWVGAATGATDLSPGTVRRAASGMLRHFLDHGAVDGSGLLSVGWHGAWPAIAQSYSGSGSPYWAAKGMLGLALPPDHPVWTMPEEPLPVERGDVRRVVAAPGWLVSGTRTDGVVRVVNHGTDHARVGDDRTDAPLYARIGYSTATAPPLAGSSPSSPVDSSVVLLDAGGTASHRSGFETLRIGDDGVAGYATSRFRAHWVRVDDEALDYGLGRRGAVRWGPVVRVGSLVRGAWEVRVVRVEPPPGNVADRTVELRVGGWPVAGTGGLAVTAGPRWAEASNGRLHSRLVLLHPDDDAGADVRAGVWQEVGTSPLGEEVAVPWVTVRGGGPVVALVRLGGVAAGAAPTATVDGGAVVVAWPDAPPSRLEL